MSIVLQNTSPKPRRRTRKNVGASLAESTINDKELNDAKMLDDIRQSIEKSDNTDVMKNNLFASEVPDKMEKRRRHRRTEKLEGKENMSFEPDIDLKPQINGHLDARVDEEKPQRRRRRRPKPDEVETKNEELSQPPDNGETIENEQPAEGDAAKHRRRRRRKDKQELIEANEEAKDVDIVYNPLSIEDNGRVLNIMIHRTDRLKTDLNVLHPMIRVNIIDLSTGKVLIKQNRDRKVTSCNEDTEKVNVVLPMMTQPFDFKSRRVTIPAWEESLVFNENANYLIKNPNVIYFFEVLDLNPSYSVDKTYPIQQESSGFHHIAWAFLRPISANGDFNTDHKVRLQLYENGPLQSRGDSYSTNTFYWWKQGFRRTYPSTLYVTVAAIILNPEISSKYAMRSMFPNQKEGAPDRLIDSNLPGFTLNKQHVSSVLQQWSRLPSQTCHIPNVPHMKLFAGADGANIISFSPDGNWLACGAVESMDNFPVLLYDMTTASHHATSTFSGHNRIIHNLAWCHKSEFLASASADGTCRVWRIKIPKTEKENDLGNTVDTETTEPAALTAGSGFGDKRVLSHPCFVYSVLFHPRKNTILITAGYDKIIRVWDLRMNKKEILQQMDGHKGFINCVLFSLDGRSMYSGDSKGEIRIWNIPPFELNNQSIYAEKWVQSDIIAEQDIKGVIINHLILHPNGKRLYVHSRDGSIRLIDLKIKAMVLKFHGIVNSEKNLRCHLSPCGSFLFCGSEDCSAGSQVFVWNAHTGDQVAVFKELGMSGPISSIDYHPKCHMIAFSAVGNESSILIYVYMSEQAQFEIGFQSGNSNPGSPRLHPKQPYINMENMTKLDDVTFKHRNLENDMREFNSFKQDYEMRSTDRLTKILNTLNTVTEVERTLRSANRSMDRNMQSTRNQPTSGYTSGPEEKGRLMRSSSKAATVESIPMTLNLTSKSKANFTFKPPPSSKHREKSQAFLGEVVALYDYQAERSDEISFARGEVIKIVFRDGKNWLLGETRDGKQGYLPSNYVAGDELIPEAPNSPKITDNSPPPRKPRKTQFKNKDEVIDDNTNASVNSSPNKTARSRRRLNSTARETPQ